MPTIELTISEAPIEEAENASGEWGAELRFLGLVRGTEQGQPIAGITYSAYLPMALQVLERIVAEMQSQHGPHPVRVHHRLGFVANGVASIIITTAGKHSAETFARLQEYLHRIKTEVPIWKEFVPVS
jgi:molybdopterin synthase catalytic subunit